MMRNGALAPDASLPDVLAARARAASDGRLVIDVIGGVCIAVGVAVWHPSAWLIPFCVAVCLAAFGAWGIADREITERAEVAGSRMVRVLHVLQLLTVAAGALAAAAACYAVLAVTLGRWIS
jgi:hypothetical protein